MDIATLPQLLANLEQSALLSPEQLTTLRKAAQSQTDSQVVARAMVKQGLVTRWQAGQLLIGRTSFMLGKYRLLELLGRGGMGHVFLAEHTTMQRRAALKLLPAKLSQDPAARERFFAEARAAAALDHANIVRAYDIQDEGDRYFLVMEYVEGKDLQRVVEEQGPLDYATAADAIRQAAEGLAHAHGRNMIHCDIKPANLLVTKQGTVKILDMGLARATDDEQEKSGGEQQVAGTVDYMAPEQALGHHSFDQRADIYSLGCTLYFLLTGQPPFPEGTVAQRIVKHQVDEPPSVLKKRPDAPKTLLKICRKMMAKEPDQRYQKAAEVVQALQEWDPKQRELKRAMPLEPTEPESPDSLSDILGITTSGTLSTKAVAEKSAAATKPNAARRAKRSQNWVVAVALGSVALVAVVAVAALVLAGRNQPSAPKVEIVKPPPGPAKIESSLPIPASSASVGSGTQTMDAPVKGGFDPDAAAKADAKRAAEEKTRAEKRKQEESQKKDATKKNATQKGGNVAPPVSKKPAPNPQAPDAGKAQKSDSKP